MTYQGVAPSSNPTYRCAAAQISNLPIYLFFFQSPCIIAGLIVLHARELTSQRRAVSLQRLRELLSADDRHLGAPPLRPRLASVGVANDATGPAPGRLLIGQTANAAARGKLTDDDDDDDDWSLFADALHTSWRPISTLCIYEWDNEGTDRQTERQTEYRCVVGLHSITIPA